MVALFELNCLCAHRGLVNWRFAHIFGFQMKCALSANQNHLSIWLSNWKHSTLIHFIQNVQNNSHTFCVQCCPCDVEPVENGQATPFTWYRIISETRFNFINNTAEECAFIKWRRRSSLAKKKKKKTKYAIKNDDRKYNDYRGNIFARNNAQYVGSEHKVNDSLIQRWRINDAPQRFFTFWLIFPNAQTD